MMWLLVLLPLLPLVNTCRDGYSIHGSHCCKHIMCPPGTEPVWCGKNTPDSTYCRPCTDHYYQHRHVPSNSSVRCLVKRQCPRTEGQITFSDGGKTRNRVCRCNEAVGYFDPFEEAGADNQEYSVTICHFRLNEPVQKASDVTVTVPDTTKEKSSWVSPVLVILFAVLIVLGVYFYQRKCGWCCKPIQKGKDINGNACHGQKGGQSEELESVSSGDATVCEETEQLVGERGHVINDPVHSMADAESSENTVSDETGFTDVGRWPYQSYEEDIPITKCAATPYADVSVSQVGSLEIEESLAPGVPVSHSSSSNCCDSVSTHEDLLQTDVKEIVAGCDGEADPMPDSSNISLLSPSPESLPPSSDLGTDEPRSGASSPPPPFTEATNQPPNGDSPESASAEHDSVNRSTNSAQTVNSINVTYNINNPIFNGGVEFNNQM